MTISKPEVHRFADASAVAENVAQRLIDKLVELQSHKDQVHLMLTGGTVGIATLAALRDNPARNAVDFKRINFWWGDERFVARNHEDRNALQARKALLNFLDLDEAKIHEFPAADDQLALDAATQNFNELVSEINPEFDLVLLGMGPDGHIASLFPGRTKIDNQTWIVAEHESPKPPQQRLSFSYSALNTAAEIWFVVAGADKQDAVAVAMGDTPANLPVGNVHGRNSTKWFIDATAGTKVFGC